MGSSFVPAREGGVDLAIFFGRPIADFMKFCDRSHPDLSRGPMSDFLSKADEVVFAADFCSANELRHPLECLMKSAPRPDFDPFPMTRTLREPHRSAARSEKSVSFFLPEDFAKSASRDIPSDFSSFKDSCLGLKSLLLKFLSMSEAFQKIGCEVLAEQAGSVASDAGSHLLGHPKISIAHAASIIAARSKSVEGSRIMVAPACKVSCPTWVEDILGESDKEMGGYAAFDHHMVVAARASEEQGRPRVEKDFAVLGEADGTCYFLASD